MKKKKILIFDQGEFPGGAELFLADVVKKLNKKKYSITVVHDGKMEYTDLYKKVKVKLIKHTLPRGNLSSFTHLFASLKVIRSLKHLILTHTPDIIITNTVRTHIYVTPVSYFLKIKHIWFLHDYTFHAQRILRVLVGVPAAIVTCSDAVRTWLIDRTSNKYEKKISTIVTFGAEPKELKKFQSVRKSNDIIMVGNFTKWKGHKIFIRAMQKVIRKYPNVKSLIVGKIYKGKKESVEYLVELYQLIKDFHLGSSIKIIEDEKDVLSKMAQSKILTHCSTEPEPLGRVILEGMMTGAAVISTNVGGPPTVIRQKETGYLIEPNDPEILADKIIEVMSNPKRLKKIRAEAAKEINDQHFWRSKIKKIEKIIDDC